MHARVASSGCGAVGTLSDDPSLGEAVIDAFWPHCPNDWSVMMTLMTKMMTMMTMMMTKI